MLMDYAVFKTGMKHNGKTIFEQGKKYEILGEIDGKYAVSYMDKKDPMACSTVPKDYDGFTVVSTGP